MRTIVYIEFDDDDRMTVRDLGSGLVVIMPPDPGVLAQLHGARAGHLEAFLDNRIFLVRRSRAAAGLGMLSAEPPLT